LDKKKIYLIKYIYLIIKKIEFFSHSMVHSNFYNLDKLI